MKSKMPTMDEIVAANPMTVPSEKFDIEYIEKDDDLETIIEKYDGDEERARHIKAELEKHGGFAAIVRCKKD